jgi:hypothetical protein
MAILEQVNLSINGKIVAYEGKIKIEAGSIKREAFPQRNGSKIVVSDVSTNLSKITIPIRNTPASRKEFTGYFNNGDNNIITAGDENFSSCMITQLPEREDLGIVEYIFIGDPAI